MLVCKVCGGNHVYGIIPNALQLEVELDKVGDITERLLREAGMWDANSRAHSIRRMVVSEQIKFKDLTDTMISEFACRNCGEKGPIEIFDSVNFCRCRNRTDDVYICKKHEFLLCANCIEGYMCDECSISACILNPENSKTHGYREIMGDLLNAGRRSRDRAVHAEPEIDFGEDDDDFEPELAEETEQPRPILRPIRRTNPIWSVASTVDSISTGSTSANTTQAFDSRGRIIEEYEGRRERRIAEEEALNQAEAAIDRTIAIEREAREARERNR